jgi:hypothetical protein
MIEIHRLTQVSKMAEAGKIRPLRETNYHFSITCANGIGHDAKT